MVSIQYANIQNYMCVAKYQKSALVQTWLGADWLTIFEAMLTETYEGNILSAPVGKYKVSIQQYLYPQIKLWAADWLIIFRQ